jgi:hypothetical protein
MFSNVKTTSIDYFGWGGIACGIGVLAWWYYKGVYTKTPPKHLPFLYDPEYKKLVAVVKKCEGHIVTDGDRRIDCHHLSLVVLKKWMIEWYDNHPHLLVHSRIRDMSRFVLSDKDLEDYTKYCEGVNETSTSVVQFITLFCEWVALRIF